MVSVTPSNSLIKPLFSATNTRPSLEKRTAVGWLSPVNTVFSENPEGTVTAPAGEAKSSANGSTRKNAAHAHSGKS